MLPELVTIMIIMQHYDCSFKLHKYAIICRGPGAWEAVRLFKLHITLLIYGLNPKEVLECTKACKIGSIFDENVKASHFFKSLNKQVAIL